ncbi:MAG: hypothetical protein JRN34_04165 [Nitrososphaerota archaeon]|nr:hypothetical protein [Nitrososphaerota archaeon]MDG6942102.1 hypothetical protein [Nitrososphaerota archaeon]MDG6942567.1 hypothetical protein [Nitrososphaerota archaeon]MDG6948354.1 hypothetical protein [Nitrososphaerota archaeon]MDG6950280.1 hypothetical protein [Nitrososphaerota archaeon]
MQKVVFDSSFLMTVVEKPTTWFEDIVEALGTVQPILLDCVKAELQKLALGGGGRSRTARVALDLASRFAPESCGGASVDDEIVSAARTSGAYVATMDSGLLTTLKAARIRAVTLSSGRIRLV